MQENEGLDPQSENEIIGKKAVKETIKDLLKIEDPGLERVLVIRHDNPKQELDLRDRKHFNVSGVIDTVSRYLSKRSHLIDHENTTVFVNRDKMTIDIQSNETDFWGDKLGGSLEIHPDFKKFNINTGARLTTAQMGDFFRMNRAFFVSSDVNLNLVTVLKKFEGTVSTMIEEKKELSGNQKNLREIIVNHNIPAAFKLKMGLFKGLEAKVFEVETKIEVSTSGDIVCSLESPEAQEIMERYKNEVIDEEIQKIETVAPQILIIEK